MGSDVTRFSQSVESKSDKRSTELHHHSFEPEEISLFCCCLNCCWSTELHLDPEEISILLLSKTLLLTLLIATSNYFGIWNLLTRNAIFAWIQTPHV